MMSSSSSQGSRRSNQRRPQRTKWNCNTPCSHKKSDITSILATSSILLSSPPPPPPRLLSSLFSFKLFFSSLSSLDSASTLRHLLPNHSSASISFNSPSQTLDSLSDTLNSISSIKLTYSPANASHTASSLLQIARDYGWEFDIENLPGKIHSDPIDVRSNLVILLSPVCRSLKSLAEFMCVDVRLSLVILLSPVCRLSFGWYNYLFKQ
ncbi:hypothetical protein LXL04_021649 [Taraxacum kok-saghyz]